GGGGFRRQAVPLDMSVQVEGNALSVQDGFNLSQGKVGDHPVRLHLFLFFVVEEVNGDPLGVGGHDPSAAPSFELGDATPADQIFGADIPGNFVRLEDAQDLASVIEDEV